VFIPLGAFRATFHPGKKLGKIFVSVDAVAHVDRVVGDLRGLAEADVVTAPEAVSTARTSLSGLAAASTVGALVLLAAGAILVGLVMVLTTKERIPEIGTLKALGASDGEVAGQFLAEVFTLTGMAGAAALPLAYAVTPLLRRVLGLALQVDGAAFLLILAGAALFGAIGSGYPVVRGLRLSPVEALRKA
jgi:ABC-type antimicrobial peptide transport system permease subunit